MYVGRSFGNRQRFIKSSETGRRQARLNPVDQWLVVEEPDLRIVDEENVAGYTGWLLKPFLELRERGVQAL